MNLHEDATWTPTACATLYGVSRSRKIILWLVAAPLLVIVLLTVAWAADGWASSDKVARNVTLAATPVGHESPEELDASATGSDLTVAFNPDYLAAGVEAVSAEQITLSTIDALKPAVVRGVGSDDYLYLLMPVRVP